MKSRDHGARQRGRTARTEEGEQNETESEKGTAEGDQAENRRHHGHRRKENKNNPRLQASKADKPRESTRYLNKSVSAGARTTDLRSGKTPSHSTKISS